MHPALSIALIFVGCCTDVVFLEVLVRNDPGCGNLVTCFHFLFIAAEGFIFTADFGRKKRVVPLGQYINLTVLMFVTSVLNNYVLNFNVSMPLHMIFRSGSLITNMILGILIMNKSYKLSKYLSVILITAGLILCTMESGKIIKSSSQIVSESESWHDMFIWSLGIAMLTLSLFLSARMGLFQEALVTKFGKHPKETMLYSHILPLPGFLLLSSDIYKHLKIFNASEMMQLPLVSLPMPKLWFFLIGNTLAHYTCSMSVFQLTAECSSLTVTLVVTLRKFISLLFSILYFKNPFTIVHWIGSIFVFGGTIIFTEAYKIKVSKDKAA